MVDVSGVRSVASPASRASKAKAGSGFVVNADRADAASGTSASAPILHASMLTLQETATETVGDRDARRHGHAMLEVLAALQRAMLLQADGTDRALGQLAALAEAVPEASTPQLGAIVASIKLRARIELARRG